MKIAFLLAFFGLGLVGCNDENFLGDWRVLSPDDEPAGQAEGAAVTSEYVGIETLAVRPAYVQIVGIGSTVQLTADIWFKDGSLSEAAKSSVTPPALAEVAMEPEPIPLKWSTENYGIADVDDTGLVTAVSSGETFIHLHIDGHEALARIIVRNTSSLDPNIDSTEFP